MNRVWGMLKWVREKVNIKLALVALVLATGLFTAWQCYVRFGKSAPLPEPKKILTGGGGVPENIADASPASAESPAYGADPNGVQQPPAAPQFAFNPNAFPPSTQPPPNPQLNPPPAYGDPTTEGQPAPYQPPVAGTGDFAPAYGDDPQVPPNPIRGNPVTVGDDPAAPNTAPNTAEQPLAQPLPFAQPPDAQPPYVAGPAPGPAPLTAPPSPSEDANRFSNPPPAPYAAGPNAPAPLPEAPAETQPLAPYAGPSPSAAPLSARSLGGYGSPAVAAPRELAGREPAGQGTPGDRQFEGAQTPAVTLEKIAPAEIQVGKLAVFELRVKNVGQIAAQQVLVTDQVPKGTQLVETKPQFQRAADGSLAWQIGTMQPGEEQVIQLHVMPQAEGEIGSVAQVSFAASATARSVCTRPLLAIEHTAPQKLLIGESLNMVITVTNPGTGAATGVVIEEDVPAGLTHVAGAELEYEVGTLRPGESKRLELTLRADKAGIIKNTIVVRGDANLSATHQINIEVVAPQLQVGVVGPKKRFLERPATYTVSVSNPGTASARDVELVAYLPRGMKFVESDSHGTYDPQQHAVFWTVDELPATKTGNVKLTAMPHETGDQKLRIEGRADLGLSTAFEQVVSVDASAELIHSIADLSDPIEVGSDTTYEIRVTNIGTKTATNVRIAALLPPELKALSGEGPTRAANDGSRVIFEPLARLNPQEEAVFRVQANAQKAGDYIIRVQLSSTEWPTPVTREESTRVYSDR